MEIKEEKTGEVLVLSPDGDLSTGEDCQALERRLSAALASGTRFLVVDCGRVGHLTSPALRALLLASRKLSRIKGRLVLCGMAAKVQKAFSISGFDKDFTVLPTREAAVAAAGETGAAVAKAAPAPALSRGASAPPDPARREVLQPPPVVPPPSAAPRPAAAAPAPAAREEPRPAAPDPRVAVAARLLAAFGAGPAAGVEPEQEPPPAKPAADAVLADALARAFDVQPA